MRLKKGSQVEVFSKNEIPTGSWLCAEIISGNGHTYSIRYGRLMTASEATVERVPRKVIRPCPPPADDAEDDWVPGNHVEAFQNMSWKTATIVKALGGNNFLIRLLGESREFRAHRSLLRVRMYWQDDKWSMIGQGDAHCTVSMKKKHADANKKLYVGGDCLQFEKNRGVMDDCFFTKKRKKVSAVGSTYIEAHDIAVQKVRAIEKDVGPKQIYAENISPLRKKVDAYISPQETICGKYLHTNFHVETTGFSEIDTGRWTSNEFNDRSILGRPVDTDSRASSAGSCSVANGLSYCSIKYENLDTNCFSSVAESFCGPGYEEEKCYLSKNEELVHRLELHSYRSAMKELYASGPLSWEDEMKVTNIRRALHISNDEHLMEVRNLIASDTRTPIC
ncbi:hypothetical protein U1Q18_006682 [Sarracenia purpurea var. burkii]